MIDRFLKRSFLDRALGKTAEAAEHALWAAWAADDADDPSSSRYRSEAAALFLKAASAIPAGSEEFITTRTRTVDVLRRAGDFGKAIELADDLLAAKDLDPTIRSVIELGRNLAQAGDASRHTVTGALERQA